MVDGAAERVNRDAGLSGPGCAVGRGAQYEVVGGASGAEAAVLPDGVDGARGVDCGGG